ncbi:ionotropic receptor 75a-like [Bradysia coprophila]|uniref:ionotropic receptor 75a-like n=1 Tax=Bradysia coprophila TaxID=38358 RepID=UPI00187D88B2|nr:ionotropic receptor 75a-like [Bradysia coprophila]
MAPSSIKDLQHRGIWTNVWDISADVNSHFFDRYTNPPCVVIDLRCNKTKFFLGEMSKRVLFHQQQKWLMWSESRQEAFDYLNDENINFDAEIIVAIPSGQGFYGIYEAYNPSYRRGGRLNITEMGQWNEAMGWNVMMNQTKIERRRNLNGLAFPTVVTLANIPKSLTFLEHLQSNEFVHLDSISRYMYRLFLLMMEMYNFKVNLKLTNLWGLKDDQGYWHGAVGALNRSQVDFCVTGLRWANERYGVYEQTTAAYHEQFLFMFRHPKIQSTNVFLSPFELAVWLTIFALGFCSAFVVRQIFYIENQETLRGGSIKNGDINDDSYSNSILMIFAFIFQQGYDAKPSLISSRIVITTMLLFSVLIYQFYSSFIVGSLLTEAPKNIKTVKQLLNSHFDFGVDIVPYVLDNFRSATEESTIELYNKIMQNPGKALMPLETGLSLLKRGGFVFNTDGSYAYHVLKDMLTDSEKCDLQDIVYLPKQPVGLAVTNKSPFRELVKISIHKFSETGVLSYNQKTWYGVRPKCEVNQLFVAPIDISHFSSALYILLAGIFTSTIILVIEVMVNRKRKCEMAANDGTY